MPPSCPHRVQAQDGVPDHTTPPLSPDSDLWEWGKTGFSKTYRGDALSGLPPQLVATPEVPHAHAHPFRGAHMYP